MMSAARSLEVANGRLPEAIRVRAAPNSLVWQFLGAAGGGAPALTIGLAAQQQSGDFGAAADERVVTIAERLAAAVRSHPEAHAAALHLPRLAGSVPPLRCIAVQAFAEELTPSQVTAIGFINRRVGSVIKHAPGSGKTLIAVISVQCWLDASPSHRAVVVTPVANMKQFSDHFTVAYGQVPYIVQRSDKELPMGERVFLINPERFQKLRPVCSRDIMLVLDESHMLLQSIDIEKDPTDRTTGAVTRAQTVWWCASGAGKRVLLTATPVRNTHEDLINLVAFARSQPPIAQAALNTMISSWDVSALREYLGCLFSVKNADPEADNRDMPAVTEYDAVVRMSEQFFKLYKNVEVHKIESKAPNTITDKDPEQLAAFWSALRTAANVIGDDCPKCEWVVRQMYNNALHPGALAPVSNASPDPPRSGPGTWMPRKTFIFSSRDDAGAQIMGRTLQKYGISHIVRTGSDATLWHAKSNTLTYGTFESVIAMFNSPRSKKYVRVLIGTPSVQLGVSLRAVRDVFLLEPSWSREDDEQAFKRAVRRKSHASLPEAERTVTVYNITLVKPVDTGNIYDEHAMLEQFRRELMGAGVPAPTMSEKLEQLKRRLPSFVKRYRDLSVDQIIRNIQVEKQKRIAPILKLIDDLSVERNPGCR